MLIFGAHISIAEGFAAAARKAVDEYGSNAMQIFTKSPRGRSVKPFSETDLEEYRKIKPRLKYVVAHSSYLLNFGKPLSEITWAEKDLMTDFERLKVLDGNGIVVHVGKAMDGDREKAFKNIVESAKKIIDQTANTNITYILENTAGQGSEIGYKLEHLAKINKAMSAEKTRFKFCLDTAHMWAAGYDFSTAKSTQEVLLKVEQSIGTTQIACFHFNDSKKELGSKVDRHENLGKGLIPLDGLKIIAKFAKKNSIPIILETPDKNPDDRINDITLLKTLVAS